MQAEHRAFFAALGFTRTFGHPVERVFAKGEHRESRFSIALEGEFLRAYDAAQRVSVEGKLPLIKFLPSQRIVAFKGRSDMFQGYDHGDNTHFRVKIVGEIAELFDVQANKAFFYVAIEENKMIGEDGDGPELSEP